MLEKFSGKYHKIFRGKADFRLVLVYRTREAL